MTDKRMTAFRLDDETLAQLDELAALYDREYERNFGRPPAVEANRSMALRTAVARELDRRRLEGDEARR